MYIIIIIHTEGQGKTNAFRFILRMYTSMVKKKVKFDLFLILYTSYMYNMYRYYIFIDYVCECVLFCSVLSFTRNACIICVALIVNTIPNCAYIYTQTRFIARTRTFPGPTPLPRPPHHKHITI